MAKKPGLYANIAAKKRRIKSGSGETMRKAGSKGAPAKGIFKKIARKKSKSTQLRSDKMKKAVAAPKGFHWMKANKTFKLMKGEYKPHAGAVKTASFDIQTTHKKGTKT